TLGNLIMYHGVKFRVGIEATYEHINFTMSVLGVNHDVTAQQLTSYIQPHFPDVLVYHHTIAPARFPLFRRWALYQFPPNDWHEVMLRQDTKSDDPLSYLIRLLETLQVGEMARIEFLMLGYNYLPEQVLMLALFERAAVAGYTVEP